MATLLIENALLVNEGKIQSADVFIRNERIEKIAPSLSGIKAQRHINAEGLYLFPGVIDDQVHFREPGLTHKANIQSEARAAVAGGTTSFMEMPNTKPATLTQELLQEKYDIAARTSLANYSFFMGASNDNLEEVLKTNASNVCGIKIFMGSSTGNMLVDDEQTLENIFSKSPMLIATHCEDELTIMVNTENYKTLSYNKLKPEYHHLIRNERACWVSSSMAVDLAKKHNTRLHVLHLTTTDELSLFDNTIPLEQKRITAEVCVHHLWFTANDYAKHGNDIKCNPAIKAPRHREALWTALLDNRLDIIATDHAPHTREEKNQPYVQAPAGLPLVQHSLQMMLQAHVNGRISLERIAEKMAHAPAVCFRIKERGFVREGYFADLVLVDLNRPYTITPQNILYRCGWSPLENETMNASITHTIVSGHLAYENGVFNENKMGERLEFNS